MQQQSHCCSQEGPGLQGQSFEEGVGAVGCEEPDRTIRCYSKNEAEQADCGLWSCHVGHASPTVHSVHADTLHWQKKDAHLWI